VFTGICSVIAPDRTIHNTAVYADRYDTGLIHGCHGTGQKIFQHFFDVNY
jgi:metal-dependent hydrolase (beta-lactamase superfamily II)